MNSAAERAIADFDQDGDQLLSPTELEKCPGIADAISRYDRDQDGQVSHPELVERFKALSRNGKTGMYSLVARILLDEKPLPHVKVTLIPEDFWDGAVSPASGIASRNGLVRPAVEDVKSSHDDVPLRGVQPGVYRVEFSSDSAELQEILSKNPPQGLEVSEGVLGANIIFRLSSS